MIDSRAGRVLEEGNRSMLDDEEWDWVDEHVSGDFDHVLIATSLPWLLGRGMHYAEAWSEAVAGGAWGEPFAPLAERVRQTVDLEHWAAFQESFARLAELLRSVAAGERGRAPGLGGGAVGRRAPRLPVRGRLPARLGRAGATSARPSARPTATRSSPRSGG